MQKPTKANAVLVCDKCAFIFRQWSDTCPDCKHDLVNVCTTYGEAKLLRRKIKPKSQSGAGRHYRTRSPRAREAGPKVISKAQSRTRSSSTPAVNSADNSK